MRGTLRKVLLCGVLGFGSLVGVPMRAEEVEELMWAMNRPKLAETKPEETDEPEWLKGLLRQAGGR